MKFNKSIVIFISIISIHLSVFGSDTILFYSVVPLARTLIYAFQGLPYLSYPLLGWLADAYFNRYKFIRCSLGLTLSSTAIGIVLLSCYIFHEYWPIYILPGGMCVALALISAGMFESTAIQFGMDQMMEASSNELSSFIHWYYWSAKLGRFGFNVVLIGVLFYYTQCKMQGNNLYDLTDKYATIIGVKCIILSIIAQFIVVCVSLCLMVCSKKKLNIDKTAENPWILVYKVLQYSWKHTCPQNRSALTYWEQDIPSRINLGKHKYGGPFTNEEVEDTKTLFRMLFLLITLVGYQFSSHDYATFDQLIRRIKCPSYWFGFLADSLTISILTVIIGIPVFEFLRKTKLQNYFPNMLKRIGIGLLCCLVKEIINLTLVVTRSDNRFASDSPTQECYFLDSYVMNNGTCSKLSSDYGSNYFAWLVLPSVLDGLSFLLVFMTALEFICAQAPLRMKGMLIGLWYSTQTIYYFFIAIPEVYTTEGYVWEVFQEAKIFLIFLSFISFLCVSKWYRYRERDEVVPWQFLIEEVYDRELNEAARLEQEQSKLYIVAEVSEKNTLLEISTDKKCSYGSND